MMNKLTLLAAIVALIVAGFSLFRSYHTSELVYVDVNKLLDGYKRTKVVRAEFQKKAQAMNANVDSLLKDWQAELKKYEKERSRMTRKELKLKQELLANKQNQINNYQEAVQKKLKEEDQKVTQTVINDINDYVKEYGKKHHYDIIFGASGTGNIMYAKETTDLTDIILEGLNKEYEGK